MNEELVNLTGMPSLRPLQDANSVRHHQHTRCFHLLNAPHNEDDYTSKRVWEPEDER